MTIDDDRAYRRAIEELQKLGDTEPNSAGEKRRHELQAAIQAYAAHSRPEERGKPAPHTTRH